MKLLNKFLIPFAVLSLAACSSMEVDEAEAISENFPEDFDGAVYMELHPELRSLQVRNYVADYNAGVKDLLPEDSVKADTAAFSADTSLLHQIYTEPTLAGYTEAHWQLAFSPVVSDSLVCQVENVYEYLNLKKVAVATDSASGEDKVDSTDIKLYRPITVVRDTADTTKIISVSGLTDTAATDPETFVLSDSLFLLSGTNMGKMVKDTLGCDTIPKETPGSLPALTVKYLKNFNFVDTRDDLSRLKTIPVDTLAISLQYVMYGESHGWAYRRCKESEKSNPIISEEFPGVTKRYCADADGIVREIK